MAKPSPPETDLAAVRDYCDAKVPLQHRTELRVECETRGTTVTINEVRAPWDADAGPEWTRHAVAQLRFDPSTHLWSLYFADRNRRWRPYDPARSTTDVDDLTRELDEDPTGVFWG